MSSLCTLPPLPNELHSEKKIKSNEQLFVSRPCSILPATATVCRRREEETLGCFCLIFGGKNAKISMTCEGKSLAGTRRPQSLNSGSKTKDFLYFSERNTFAPPPSSSLPITQVQKNGSAYPDAVPPHYQAHQRPAATAVTIPDSKSSNNDYTPSPIPIAQPSPLPKVGPRSFSRAGGESVGDKSSDAPLSVTSSFES